MRPMQLRHHLRRLRLMLRVVLVIGLLIGLLALPATRVAACSCAGFGSMAEVVGASDLAFVGKVLEAVDAGAEPKGVGALVRYTFDVERASAATDTVVHVHSLDDAGGSMCGFSFGAGERWFVATHRVEGSLHTSLCSGNAAMDEMGPDDVELLSMLLTAEPTGAPAERPVSVPFPLLVAVAGLALVAGASVVAFRRERPS